MRWLKKQKFAKITPLVPFSTDTGVYTHVRLLFAFFGDFECYGDFPPIDKSLSGLLEFSVEVLAVFPVLSVLLTRVSLGAVLGRSIGANPPLVSLPKTKEPSPFLSGWRDIANYLPLFIFHSFRKP